ncbi:hypothetical protein ABTZ99_37810 [Actinosynnema sp. NPDC002837]
MTSTWKRGSQRRCQRAAIVAGCPSSDQQMSASHWHHMHLSCADSPP